MKSGNVPAHKHLTCTYPSRKLEQDPESIISVVVELWNNVEMDARMVNSFLVFKGIIYKTILESYKCD